MNADGAGADGADAFITFFNRLWNLLAKRYR